jgi:hypothetical protein
MSVCSTLMDLIQAYWVGIDKDTSPEIDAQRLDQRKHRSEPCDSDILSYVRGRHGLKSSHASWGLILIWTNNAIVFELHFAQSCIGVQRYRFTELHSINQEFQISCPVTTILIHVRGRSNAIRRFGTALDVQNVCNWVASVASSWFSIYLKTLLIGSKTFGTWWFSVVWPVLIYIHA